MINPFFVIKYGLFGFYGFKMDSFKLLFFLMNRCELYRVDATDYVYFRVIYVVLLKKDC